MARGREVGRFRKERGMNLAKTSGRGKNRKGKRGKRLEKNDGQLEIREKRGKKKTREDPRRKKR